jgi:K+-transporting ATPase A subunit
MLWTIIVVILILWLAGFIGGVGGGLIHLLLVVALFMFLIQIITGKRPEV